ncbi:hypothetical protein K1719_041440 [Acacia pycnantha]|nr:hypothetical protein K1719_041440 [Acacia pycnantha]
MNTFSHVPPGFRFHPTDEELVDYYLRKRVASKRIDLDVIKDVDLYKIEPWDLQELCKIGTEEQNDWYFFSHKDKKYPTGTRTNRATKAGFWKATGRDKAIYRRHCLIGMRKTLVYYKGRAPNGQKSDCIMHEYRLETNENATSQEEGWVVCRVFKKKMTSVRRMEEYESACWFEDQVSLMQELESAKPISQPYASNYHQHHQYYVPCKQELHQLRYNVTLPHEVFLQLPQLESPKVPYSSAAASLSCNNSTVPAYAYDSSNNNNNGSSLHSPNSLTQEENIACGNNDHQVTTDWRVLDKFVATQLSSHHQQADASKEVIHVDEPITIQANDRQLKRPEIGQQEYASTSTSSCQIDLWN